MYIYYFDGTSFKNRINSLQPGKKLPAGGNNIFVFGLDGCPLKKMSTEFSAFSIELIRVSIYTVLREKKKQVKELVQQKEKLDEYNKKLETLGSRNSFSKRDKDAPLCT